MSTGGGGDSTGGMGGTTMSAGGGGTGGGGPTLCGGTSALAEDYSGEPLYLWETNDWGGASVSQSNGELVIGLPNGGASESGAYLISKYYYDFRKDAASIEVPSATNPATSSWAYLSVGPSDADYVEIYQAGGLLYFGYEVGNDYTKLESMPYDPVAHRYWQLRDDGQIVNFETSPDGSAWSVQAQVLTANLFPLDFVRVVIGGGADSGQTGPGEARFDHLNGGGAPKQKLCPVSSITDDFDDGLESVQWARSWEDAPDMLTEESGQLVIHYPPNSTDEADLTSARAFDLTDSSVTVEWTAVPDASDETHIAVELNGPGDDDPADNDVEMHLSGGQLEFVIFKAGQYQQLGSLLYSPVDHRWWRIREASNTLFWETSPDGSAWTTRLQVSPVPVPIDVVEVEISGYTYGPQGSPKTSAFDNVNLPPAP